MLRQNLSSELEKFYYDGELPSSMVGSRTSGMLKATAVEAGKTSTVGDSSVHIQAVAKAVPDMGHDELSTGLHQRFRAINAFLDELLMTGSVPEFIRRDHSASAAVSQIPRGLLGTRPHGGSWTRLVSTDLFRHPDLGYVVLDHDVACPVGLQRLSQLSGAACGSDAVDGWVASRLRSADPNDSSNGNSGHSVVLDAGSYSTAGRENEYLAAITGSTLVRGRDVVIDRDGVAMIHQGHRQRISLLIRRVEDSLLDPNCFRPDSLVGVPGLVRACRDGSVNVLNAPGTGIISNRAISRLIPQMIGWYLAETPLLNSIETLMCSDQDQRDRVLNDLEHFAVRTIDPRHPARPFFGVTAGKAEKADVTGRLLRDPGSYVARPLVREAEAFAFGNSTVAGFDLPAGYHMRTYAGLGSQFDLLPFAVGRMPQPDGGATLSILSDTTTFLIHI